MHEERLHHGKAGEIKNEFVGALLNRYRTRVLNIRSAPPTIAYPKLGDYDAQYVLRSASARQAAE